MGRRIRPRLPCRERRDGGVSQSGCIVQRADGARNSGFEGSSAVTNGQARAPRRVASDLQSSVKKRWRRRAESNRCRGLCRPLPGPLGHAAWAVPEVLLYNVSSAGRCNVGAGRHAPDFRCPRDVAAPGDCQRHRLWGCIRADDRSRRTRCGPCSLSPPWLSPLLLPWSASAIEQIGDYMGPGADRSAAVERGQPARALRLDLRVARGAHVCGPVSTWSARSWPMCCWCSGRHS